MSTTSHSGFFGATRPASSLPYTNKDRQDMKYSKKKSIVLVAMLLILSFCFLAGCQSGIAGGESGNPGSDSSGKSSAGTYKIITDKSKNIEYEEFDNGYVSMDIPKGWKFVAHPQADTVHYTFQVVNPENKDYQIYFGMKSEGFLSTEKERQWYASLYPTSPFALYPAIDPQNTEGFFRVFSQASAVDGPVVGDFVFPTINDFTVLETLGNAPVGGDIVRGSYKNDNGDPIEGIFTATPKKVSLYYVNAVSVYSRSPPSAVHMARTAGKAPPFFPGFPHHGRQNPNQRFLESAQLHRQTDSSAYPQPPAAFLHPTFLKMGILLPFQVSLYASQ